MLLLNVPPNREGLLSEPDVASLKAFRSILDETFKTNLAQSVPKTLTDGQLGTFVSMTENQPLEFDLKRSVTFDRAMIQEAIANGQTIAEGTLDAWTGTAWQPVQAFTTVGHKRLLRFAPVTTSKIRLVVTKALGPVQLAEIGLFNASARE